MEYVNFVLTLDFKKCSLQLKVNTNKCVTDCKLEASKHNSMSPRISIDLGWMWLANLLLDQILLYSTHEG